MDWPAEEITASEQKWGFLDSSANQAYENYLRNGEFNSIAVNCYEELLH